MNSHEPHPKPRPLRKSVLKFSGYLVLIAGAVLSFLPFYWMLILSTHSSKTIFKFPPPLLPSTNLLPNYQNMMKTIPFWRNFWNSNDYSNLYHRADAPFCINGRICLCDV